MKQITAYIKPFMLPKVQEALMRAPGFCGMTVTDGRGMGHSRLEHNSREHAPGHEFVAKVKIEMLAGDDDAERLADVIAKAAHTGNSGDGLLYITAVQTTIRIKTFDRDDRAL
jgi:nitrogen regulatory protein PII